MNAVEIEQAITDLAEQPFDAAEFPYAFLEAFGNKTTTIQRLRAGASNKSDLGGVLQTSNIHILICDAGQASLAALMRRMRLCEEQGTGIDKVLVAVELHQLPPPDFWVEGEAVRAVLYGPRRLAEMTPQERVRACYQHAALKHVSGQRMTNASLRERMGIDPQNAAQASVIIKLALGQSLIRPADAAHHRAGYVPFWA